MKNNSKKERRTLKNHLSYMQPVAAIAVAVPAVEVYHQMIM